MKRFYINSLFLCSCVINFVYAAPAYPAASKPLSAKTSNNILHNKPAALQIRSTTIQAEKNNATKYSGDVQISKGTLVITADTAIMQNKQNTLTISGNPAKFIDLVSVQEQVTASAGTINFDSTANKLILKGHASINKGGKTETNKQSIEYDLGSHSYKIL